MVAAAAKDVQSKLPLYDQVAGRIAEMIRRGTLRPGEKVPSVRKLKQQMRVSISTVLQAYQLLETRGLIAPKPQSGFYVRSTWQQKVEEPKSSKPACTPQKVSVSSPLMSMIRQSRDADAVNFGSADPPDHCLPTQRLNRLQAAIARRSREGINCYDSPPGLHELRVQIAQRMMEAGCSLDVNDLITTVGCQEAVTLCLRAITQPGDTVAIESPTYYGHLQALELLRLRAVEVPTSPRTGVELDALAGILKRQKIAACLFIPNAQNPLGFSMPENHKRDLVSLITRHGVPLVEDDIYGDLCFEGPRPGVAKCHDDAGLVLLCSSFSKTLAPGARVGWCAVPEKWNQVIQHYKFANTIGTPTLSQKMIAEFLANGGYERHLRTVRRIYAEQIQRYASAISEAFPQGTCISRPSGGFVLWVELPRGCDAMTIQLRALKEKISVAPGPLFSPSGRYKNCLRINCGPQWSDRVAAAIVRLGQMAKEPVVA